MRFNTTKIGVTKELLKRDDSLKNEKLISWTGDHDQKLIQKESFFQRHRILAIFFIVWLVFAAIALVFFKSLHFHSSDKIETKNTVVHKPPCNGSESRVVGYYTGERDVTTEQLQTLTHIIFAHVKFEKDHSLKFDNETARLRFLEMKKKAREVNEDLKVMVSISEWWESNIFWQLQSPRSSPFLMKNIIDTVVSFTKEHEIDGIEIFSFALRPYEKECYLEFMQGLRKEFVNLGKETPPLISFAVAPFKYFLTECYLWKDLVEEVDFINVIIYDYFDTFFRSDKDTFVGPTSPLFGGNRENVESTIKYITCKTGTPQKLNLVISTHATYWTDVTSPFSMNSFNWITPERYHDRPFFYLYELGEYWFGFRKLNEYLTKWQGAEYHFHNESKSSYYWIPESETFITIEDEQSLREKVKYQNQMNIGGIGMMNIDYDDDENTLLNVLAAEQQCFAREDYQIMYDCQNIGI